MVQTIPTKWHICYVVLAALYCVSVTVFSVLPPLVIPMVKILPIILLFYVGQTYLPAGERGWLSLAIVFSALGDVLLAISAFDLFIFGLGAFLIAHLYYIKVFWPISKAKLQQRQVLVVLYILYAAGMISLLAPNLGQLFIPVIIYMAVLLFMAIAALLTKKSNLYMTLGGMFFVISDSLIGFNKFYQTIEYNNFLVMFTYYTAQYLLVFGVLKRRINANS